MLGQLAEGQGSGCSLNSALPKEGLQGEVCSVTHTGQQLGLGTAAPCLSWLQMWPVRSCVGPLTHLYPGAGWHLGFLDPEAVQAETERRERSDRAPGFHHPHWGAVPCPSDPQFFASWAAGLGLEGSEVQGSRRRLLSGCGTGRHHLAWAPAGLSLEAVHWG